MLSYFSCWILLSIFETSGHNWINIRCLFMSGNARLENRYFILRSPICSNKSNLVTYPNVNFVFLQSIAKLQTVTKVSFYKKHVFKQMMRQFWQINRISKLLSCYIFVKNITWNLNKAKVGKQRERKFEKLPVKSWKSFEINKKRRSLKNSNFVLSLHWLISFSCQKCYQNLSNQVELSTA